MPWERSKAGMTRWHFISFSRKGRSGRWNIRSWPPAYLSLTFSVESWTAVLTSYLFIAPPFSKVTRIDIIRPFKANRNSSLFQCRKHLLSSYFVTGDLCVLFWGPSVCWGGNRGQTFRTVPTWEVSLREASVLVICLVISALLPPTFFLSLWKQGASHRFSVLAPARHPKW